MTPEQIAQQLRAALYTQVGGFFSNTRRDAGLCAICTAPASSPLCNRCGSDREIYGSQLANMVFPLTYVRGRMQPRHQSEHHVWQYKHRLFPDQRCMQDLQLMVGAAVALHGPCMVRAIGGRPWETVTFVPSATRQGTDHPVVELARSAADQIPGAERILLDPGPSIGAERRLVPDRFVVRPESRPLVAGRHVLVIDDTWVSGAKAQAAALALRAAGAWGVTVICVGRWLSWSWVEQQEYIRSLNAPYDAMCCPVTGGACPA